MRRVTTTRAGGVSAPPFDTFNLGDHVGDAPAAVAANRKRLAAVIGRLDGRQRTVFTLCHFGDRTPREVSAITGLNESTVRVHLFRAARKLRGLLGR